MMQAILPCKTEEIYLPPAYTKKWGYVCHSMLSPKIPYIDNDLVIL